MAEDGNQGKHSFGPTEKQEGVWDEYIGQWVIIDYNVGNKVYSGKMVEIKDGCHAFLSPFTGTRWDERGHNRVLKEDRLSVCLLGANVEPTEEESIKFYLEDSKRAKEKRDQEKEEKTNGNKVIVS